QSLPEHDAFSLNATATTAIYTLSLHDALPIWEHLYIFGKVATENNTERPDITQTIGHHITRQNWQSSRTCNQWKEHIIFKQLFTDFVLHWAPFFFGLLFAFATFEIFTQFKVLNGHAPLEQQPEWHRINRL